MIAKQELMRLRGEWQLDVSVIEKDYVLGWVLAAIAAEPALANTWIFKGGTCLRKCYYETYRFSEDLDFTVVDGGPEEPDEMIEIFKRVSDWLARETGIELEIDQRTLAHQFGTALGTPFPPAVLEIADQLLLLAVDRDDRLLILQCLEAGRVDPPELQITIGMLVPLPGLHVRLQAVPQRPQQLRDRHVLDPMPELAQPASEIPHALRGPQQQRLRITPTVLVHQTLEIAQQLGTGLRQRLASTARLTDPPRPDRLAALKLGDAPPDRADRHPRRPRRPGDPTTPCRPRLRNSPQPPLPLIQLTRQQTKLHTDRRPVNHTPISDPTTSQPADSCMNKPKDRELSGAGVGQRRVGPSVMPAWVAVVPAEAVG